MFLPAGNGQMSKCEKHTGLLQDKTKLWLSPVPKLSTSKIIWSTVPHCTADHHFALQFCPESAWSLIAIFSWLFIFKLAVSSLFPEPQLTLIYTHCMLRCNFWPSCENCCIYISFCSTLTNGKLHFSCHDQAQVAILCLHVTLCQDHKKPGQPELCVGNSAGFLPVADVTGPVFVCGTASSSPYSVHILVAFWGVLSKVNSSSKHSSNVCMPFIKSFVNDSINKRRP